MCDTRIEDNLDEYEHADQVRESYDDAIKKYPPV